MGKGTIVLDEARARASLQYTTLHNTLPTGTVVLPSRAGATPRRIRYDTVPRYLHVPYPEPTSEPAPAYTYLTTQIE